MNYNIPSSKYVLLLLLLAWTKLLCKLLLSLELKLYFRGRPRPRFTPVHSGTKEKQTERKTYIMENSSEDNG